MTEDERSDAAPRRRLFEVHDLAVALAMATRLPAPVNHARAGDRIAAAAWAAPIVGALVGALAGAVFTLGQAAGLGPAACAWAAVATQLLVTGALHEDGLADTADGLGAGGAPDRIRAIMRDSRVGVFGAAALIVALAARAEALGAIAAPSATAAALIAAGAASRAGMVALWAAAKPTKTADDGLAARAGRPLLPQALAAAALGLGVGVGAIGLAAPAALSAAAAGLAAGLLAGGAIVLLARRRLGAVTGDVLGCAQVLGEVALLSALAAAFVR